MSSSTISSVLEDLFNAPLQAAVRAEAEYLRIWAKWLVLNREHIIIQKGDDKGKVNEEVLRTAPVISLDGEVELAISLRIAEVKKKEGKLEAGIIVGPVYAGGGFSMSSKSAEESIFKASSKFVISNQRKDLTEYLNTHRLEITDDNTLTTTINRLIEDADKLKPDEVIKKIEENKSEEGAQDE